MKKKTALLATNNIYFFIFLVIVFSFLTFWRVLTFDFLRDDWGFLWATQYHPGLPLAWNLHPGTKYEDFLLFPLFGWHAFYWQAFGIFLRILAALSFSALLWGFFRSRKITILGGLFFAVNFIGLETVSWSSVHVGAADIIFMCLGFYFWTEYVRFQRIALYCASIIMCCLAVISDPARVILILPIILLFSFLYWWINPNRNLRKSRLWMVSLSVLCVVVSATFLLFSSAKNYGGVSILHTALQNPEKIKNFFASLGNLFFGWFVQIPEMGSLASGYTWTGMAACFLLLNITLVSCYIALVKKSRYAMFIFIMTLWIIVFYFPNWLFDRNLIVAGTHRYLSIAGVGYIAILTVLVSLFKNKYMLVTVASIIILCNIWTSNRILLQESSYRDQSISNYLWNNIIHDVPSNGKDSVFMYLGSDYIRGSLLDFSGAMPFAVAKKIKNTHDIPIPTANDAIILNLLCQHDFLRPSVTRWEIQKNPIPISHIYAWEVNNRKITNVSIRERKRLTNLSVQKRCMVEK